MGVVVVAAGAAGLLGACSSDGTATEPSTVSTTSTGPSPTTTAAPAPSTADEPVPDITGQWAIAEVNGTPALVDAPGFLEFRAPALLVGTTGCNNIGSTWEQHGPDELEITDVSLTRMICTRPPEGLMDQDQAVFTAIQEVVGYDATDATLALQDADGETVLLLTR